MTSVPASTVATRPLTRHDLDAVVAIDAAIERRSRRPYIERRLRAAMREPALHAQLAVDDGKGLAGFLLARVLEGEYGLTQPSLRIEMIGVRRDVGRQGIGSALLEALCAWARRRGIQTVRTQAAWNNHAMLTWLDRRGFAVAHNHIVDCPVEVVGTSAPESAVAASPDTTHGREVDYGGQSANDYEHAARGRPDVRPMRQEDLAAVARIDRRVTGRDRTLYVDHKLREAMEDSAIRISLVARLHETVAGFVMARADLGDFGRTEPVAVLDTIGVDPALGHLGVGHALMAQLFADAAALRIERVESVVAPHDLALLRFLYDVGFNPSPRLPFVLQVAV